MRRVEVMAPAHDTATVEAASRGGADAVYFGVGALNMRQHGGSFHDLSLKDIVAGIHACSLRAYQTVNSVIHEDELAQLDAVMAEAVAAGVDAVIVHDLAAIEAARRHGLEIHISTMANTTNSVGVLHFGVLGASRIVLAREVSISETAMICASTDLQVEAFVHGALCLSYSGRCIASQVLTGQSACRGECTQPCRNAYTLTDEAGNTLVAEGPLLSTKDLCLIERVPDLISAGVDVFKIEGRRRGPEYVEVTSRCYREAADADEATFAANLPRWRAELRCVENRGYSDGYAEGRDVAMTLGGRRGRARAGGALVPLAEVRGASAKGASVFVLRDAISVGQTLVSFGDGTQSRSVVREIEVAGASVDAATPGQIVFVRGVEGAGEGAVLLGESRQRRRASSGPGILVTIEGCDRVGKSTLTKRLAETLELEGMSVVQCREPGGTAFGERVREILRDPVTRIDATQEALLLSAARRSLVREVVGPALATADVVLCDRYVDSTSAYQVARGATPETVDVIQRQADAPVPDLTILLDAPVERLAARPTAGVDRFEQEGTSLQMVVREEYLKLAEAEPLRILKLDAQLGPDEVYARAISAVLAVFRGSEMSAASGEQ